ncbi:hypothetical protein OsJ_02563 [Oryza sativa Japonica Group]|uniref:Pre-mRNA processing factor 4 (PRP4)-like domain-containing protein n=1 Tax=Oryza sativa subsp. japonica TaxID=39947 RepID=A2ZVA1_ORYSJ|nr:hypothetical protein OsJ_02563 [Oryza sativa Japonica Group]
MAVPTMAPLPVPLPIAPIPVSPPRALRLPRQPPSPSPLPPRREEEGAAVRLSTRSPMTTVLRGSAHERVVQELLQRRRTFAMAVPTNDFAVRARLRRLGEPVTLFGEREMESQDRLRALMVCLEADGHLDRLVRAQEKEQGGASAKEEELAATDCRWRTARLRPARTEICARQWQRTPVTPVAPRPQPDRSRGQPGAAPIANPAAPPPLLLLVHSRHHCRRCTER